MKRIILSLAMVAAAGSVLVGGVYAYFSAIGSVNNNTVATGTLLLTVNKGAGKEIALSGIAPGYTDSTYRWFDAFNNGTLPAEYFFKFEKTAGDDALYNALVIELRDGGYTGACDGPVFYTAKLSEWVDNTKISQHNVHATNSATDAVNDNIRAGWTMRVCQKISLPETGVDQNELQGKSVIFNEVVNATQDVDPDIFPAAT